MAATDTSDTKQQTSLAQTSCSFITGPAGSGKTHHVKQKIATDPRHGVLCATTGIAAINLADVSARGAGVVTINSELGYYDTYGMEDAYAQGRLHNNLKRVFSKGRNLIVDEVSMMNAMQLDVLVAAMDQVNSLVEVRSRGGLGLILTGDFCQLSPVPQEGTDPYSKINAYAFEAECWPRFKVVRLEKIWRQENPDFLAAINAARQGDGDESARILRSLGVFSLNIDHDFQGTTILPTTREVDRINDTRLRKLIDQGHSRITIPSTRWGKQRGEWKLIPDELQIAENAYVMILCNDTRPYQYANGSTGTVLDQTCGDKTLDIRISRTGEEVTLNRITRRNLDKQCPDGCTVPTHITSRTAFEESELFNEYSDFTGKEQYQNYLASLTEEYKGEDRPYYDFEEGKWCIGAVTYMPVRLAYASTVHKTQGLSLDAVQINPFNGFFGQPGMAYVALSRCRSPENLRIVGSSSVWASRCNIAREVLPWV